MPSARASWMDAATAPQCTVAGNPASPYVTMFSVRCQAFAWHRSLQAADRHRRSPCRSRHLRPQSRLPDDKRPPGLGKRSVLRTTASSTPRARRRLTEVARVRSQNPRTSLIHSSETSMRTFKRMPNAAVTPVRGAPRTCMSAIVRAPSPTVRTVAVSKRCRNSV